MEVMTILRCPVCQTDLLIEGKRYLCGAGHSFDIARQGYVNLLLSSQRPSSAPGDSTEMIADRRAFLDADHYLPLRDLVLHRLDRLGGQLPDRLQQVLDLGCGEGYYTAAFADPTRRCVYGLDISKPALLLAAKRSDAVTWCIGTSRALPFHDRSLDVVLNIFCRPHIAETQRVLSESGVLLLVGPGTNHLQELRAVLYDDVIKQESHSLGEILKSGFTVQRSEVLSYEITLKGAAIGQLARMTPHYWRAPAAGRARLEAIETLIVQVEFVVQELGLVLIGASR
jgi:23S rRNA (guanine745-N1)-methyltransferase